ncbi:Hypothetical predicted protein [Pelobates cultripes]|uniref:Uncharacterized protein n=1 Tax=Pelobates cultripes TaxID=61616 RepID=A0AAD1RGP8_PELCU|nr:Hypothetical predicted protein [Pelobates cultripes]
MATTARLPGPTVTSHVIEQKLDVLFASFWHKIKGRTQPPTSQQPHCQSTKRLPPTRRSAPKVSPTGQASSWRRPKLHKRRKHRMRRHRRHTAQRRSKTRNAHLLHPAGPRIKSPQYLAQSRIPSKDDRNDGNLTRAVSHRDGGHQWPIHGPHTGLLHQASRVGVG